MKKIMSAFLCFIMMLYCLLSANAENKNEVSYTLSDLAELVYTTTPNPCVGAIGGEWAVLGLARSGEKISQEFYQRYYENVETTLKSAAVYFTIKNIPNIQGLFLHLRQSAKILPMLQGIICFCRLVILKRQHGRELTVPYGRL